MTAVDIHLAQNQSYTTQMHTLSFLIPLWTGCPICNVAMILITSDWFCLCSATNFIFTWLAAWREPFWAHFVTWFSLCCNAWSLKSVTHDITNYFNESLSSITNINKATLIDNLYIPCISVDLLAQAWHIPDGSICKYTTPHAWQYGSHCWGVSQGHRWSSLGQIHD